MKSKELVLFLSLWEILLLRSSRKEYVNGVEIDSVTPSTSSLGDGRKGGSLEGKEESGNSPKSSAARSFAFRELAAATGGFKQVNAIGDGGFGRVYGGHLETGQVVAIKQLNHDGHQDQRLLVYEYMRMGSLEDHLFDTNPEKEPLSWTIRMKIAVGAAKGLEYLHYFGLAKLGPVGDNTHVSTRVMGTYGYCAPENAMSGKLTLKSDIYSFDVVLLELITGRRAIDVSRRPGEQNLVAWSRQFLKDRRTFVEMIDPLLQGRFPLRCLHHAIAITAMCLQEQPNFRPLISDVVVALEYVGSVPEVRKDHNHQNQSLDRVQDTILWKEKWIIVMYFYGTREKEKKSLLCCAVLSQNCEITPADHIGIGRKGELGHVTTKVNDRQYNTPSKMDELMETWSGQGRSMRRMYVDNDDRSRRPATHPSSDSATESKSSSNRGRVSSNNQNELETSGGDKTVKLNGKEEKVRRTNATVTPNLKIFSLDELKSATKNFRPDTVLGEGGFGRVFKGWIDDKTYKPSKVGVGIPVAVKKSNSDSLQGLKEWQSEVKFLGKFSHPNLVKLLGYCWEENQFLLVYEYMQKGSLENHLFGRGPEPLAWDIRLKIAIGAARGLAFLHNSEKSVIYRDFKSSNILLDGAYNAKLSDFGLAKFGPTSDRSHVTTRVMGTYGYAAPEYMATGHLYVKSDVYGFGVVLLEMLTGLIALDPNRPSGEQNLVEYCKASLSTKKKLKKIMDPQLGEHYPIAAAFQVAQLIDKCLESDPKNRPSMEEVLDVLEKAYEIKYKPKARDKLKKGGQLVVHHSHLVWQFA
ncbi:hypothetical protein L6164_015189 [Bauhinia variegata]|uniref:Uncharacterized protein n=1 Tax=Bauhinia variegata TaxID=167791 RepID=A0ACB9NL28_BAUVA|nr:hypothetical protein L6164_015189 [Bauhinia variegata]